MTRGSSNILLSTIPVIHYNCDKKLPIQVKNKNCYKSTNVKTTGIIWQMFGLTDNSRTITLQVIKYESKQVLKIGKFKSNIA